jgi:hypothetical protein
MHHGEACPEDGKNGGDFFGRRLRDATGARLLDHSA